MAKKKEKEKRNQKKKKDKKKKKKSAKRRPESPTILEQHKAKRMRPSPSTLIHDDERMFQTTTTSVQYNTEAMLQNMTTLVQHKETTAPQTPPALVQHFVKSMSQYSATTEHNAARMPQNPAQTDTQRLSQNSDTWVESELSHEEQREVRSEILDQNGTNEEKGWKKKKHNKPPTMSLEEFNQKPLAKKPSDSDNSEEENLLSKPQQVTQVSDHDPMFFDNVQKDVANTLQKEWIQEELQKSYSVVSTLVCQLEEELAQKDETITKMKKANEDIKAELEQAKDRNQSLLKILAQARENIKSKAKKLEKLQQLNEELNQEIAELTQNLEQERSKNLSLSSELSS